MLNAAWGLQVANVGRIFRRTHLFFITLGIIAFALPAHSAPTEAQAVNPSSTKAPLVALASSFRSVWPMLMEIYVDELDNRPPLASFASSGLLGTQILRGAPFELFISADQRSVMRIMKAGKTQKDPFALVSGTLSLVSLPGGNNRPNETPTLSLVRESMATGNPMKIAIPNPRHAPYGIAAQEVLTSAGLWPIRRGSLLNAENASQALQYALSGAASFAIVPSTLVTQIPFDINITNLDPSSYAPVIHHLAVLTPAGDSARKLSEWLKTPRALNIMMQFGLSPP